MKKPSRFAHTTFSLLAGLMFLAMPAMGQVIFKMPQPGDVYKEYLIFNDIFAGNKWRVTDPNVDLGTYPQAADFLPNPTINFTIDDLQDAIRAEAVLAEWGGHIGTTGKTIAFNGNSSITVPEINTAVNGLPVGASGECYQTEPMNGVDIPLNHLVQGSNFFRANSGGQTCHSFSWGQWGIYAVVIRVYYNPATKAHPTGTISSPAYGSALSDNPTITASVGAGVDQVDFLAYYNGYDSDGDGIFTEYHHDYHYGKFDGGVSLKNHVGTATGAPWQVTWNTQHVPDQPLGGVKICARIHGSNDMWYVTPEISALSIVRVGTSTKFYKPEGVPEDFWCQGFSGDTHSSMVTIPGGDNLGQATSATLFTRTWNGSNEKFFPEPGREGHYLHVNNYAVSNSDYGEGHFFKNDVLPIPTSEISNGQNTIEWFANTQLEHGIEVHWPGPGMMVSYAGAYASPQAVAPQLLLPANNSTTEPPSPTLTWHKALIANGYRLQIASDAGFTAIVVDDSSITDTVKQVGPLAGQTQFYWRVRTRSVTGGSAFSGARTFTTFVASPILVFPANGATSVATSTRLSWQKSTGVIGYQVQVGIDPSFASGILVDDATIVDSTTVVNGLTNNTVYYWRVKTRDGGAGGPFSSPFSFTTVIAAPVAPSLISPPNTATNVATSITLSWLRSATAVSYRIQVGTDSTFSSGVALNDSAVVDSFRSVIGLASGIKYFWRVNAKNIGGTGSYSQIWNFTTISAGPTVPVLVSPAHQAGNQPTSLTFVWNAVATATGYHFQLGTDSTFATGLVKNDTSLATTNRAVVGLSPFTAYYWRVRAKNSGGYGPFAATWTFGTAMATPSTVTLLFPSSGATVSKDTARLVWSKSQPSVVMYWVDHAIDSSFTFVGVDSTSDTSLVVRQLQTSKRYYWRVRGRNLGGYGAYSASSNFLVNITAVNVTDEMPTSYVLNQNYPNPFNPTTRIAFSVPTEAAVQLEVMNLLGERVASLINRRMTAGSYEVEFDATRLSSGLYLYRLVAGATILTKKMMLVK